MLANTSDCISEFNTTGGERVRTIILLKFSSSRKYIVQTCTSIGVESFLVLPKRFPILLPTFKCEETGQLLILLYPVKLYAI